MSRAGSILEIVNGTSVREDVGLHGLSRDEKVAALRSRMAHLGGEVPAEVVSHADVVPVGEALRALIPLGGVPRRAVTQVSDTPSLVVELIEAVTAEGGFAAVVGWPELSYAGVTHLSRVVAVPDPGVDPLGVAGVLAEGLDLVVYRTPVELTLSPTQARPLLAKVRAGRAAVVMCGTQVPSPALRLTARVSDFRGIGQGCGRIQGMDVHVRAEAKGYGPVSGTVTVGQKAPSLVAAGTREELPKLRVVR